MSHILAIDQGTSGTKAIIFDAEGQPVSRGYSPVDAVYPQPGFVEQDPERLYRSVLASVSECLTGLRHKHKSSLSTISTCGITNQRETFVLWNSQGEPLSNAIVWQCKRSVEICNKLQGSGLEEEFKRRTGLIIDPYFSGTKVMWVVENDSHIRKLVDRGEVYFGTVDCWLLYRLTGGKRYQTDYTNASRTLFFNIHTLQWDDYLLKQMGLENLHLPQPKPSSAQYGASDFESLLPKSIPITALVGDSHAAAFGEGCFVAGSAKATLGTGCSILLNTGENPVTSQSGMVTTICWSNAEVVNYALEGIIVTCGATLNWLRNELGIFTDSSETEAIAASVDNNNGVYLIPAFSGLGAPHWNMHLKAAILGLTFDCKKEHLVRAALESIPYQIKDVIGAMESDSRIHLSELRTDGGITANKFVMQFLADLLDKRVVSIGFEDISALGAAYLAGLASGVFQDLAHLERLHQNREVYDPDDSTFLTQKGYAGWQKHLRRMEAI